MSENRNITVRGVVIAHRGAGEGNLRVSLYSDALGLVESIARSGREERSQLRSHLQEGTVGVFTLVLGRDMWRVTGVVNARNLYFDGMGKKGKESVARVLGMVRQFVRGEGNDPYLFEVLSQFLAALPRLETEEIKNAEYLVVLRMLSALGYVQGGDYIKSFLGTNYNAELFDSVTASRRMLVRTINEGMSAADLS